MNKYIVINADKGSYDRQIEISLDGVFNNINEAVENLKKWIWVEDVIKNIDKIIKNKQKYYYDEYGDKHYFEYNETGILIYYSNGCRATNEYDGHSCKILEIKGDIDDR